MEPLGGRQGESGNMAWEWGRRTGQKSLAKKDKENGKGVSLNVTEISPRDQVHGWKLACEQTEFSDKKAVIFMCT